MIEVVLQINVRYFSPSVVRDVPKSPTDGHLGIHPGSETVLVRQQVRLEDGADYQQRSHLGHTIGNGGNAERPLSAVAFRYPDAQEGLRPVAAVPQLLPQLFQPLFNAVLLDLLERLAVRARGAGIVPTAPIRLGQDVRPADLVPQAVEAEGWFSLRSCLCAPGEAGAIQPVEVRFG